MEVDKVVRSIMRLVLCTAAEISTWRLARRGCGHTFSFTPFTTENERVHFSLSGYFSCELFFFFFSSSEGGKGSWEPSSRPSLHSQTVPGLAWLARRAEAALGPHMLTDPRAEWEPDGVASLTRRKSCSCPDKVTLASCHYLPGRQGGTQPHPAAISARQRPITSRQRATSKHTWIKPDGSAWSPVAKVGVVIISDMLKL